MKKRLLASLLVLVMVVGLLPSTAFASSGTGGGDTDSGVSTQANTDGTYNVTFVRDAFNTTQVTVHSVYGLNNQALTVSSATLDGMRLQIGDEGMDANGLAGGYGLLNVQVGDQFYYLTSATWGANGQPVGTFYYDDVEAHANDGIYLHYTAAENVTIPVTAVNGNDSDAEITTGQLASGVIDEFVVQEVVANETSTWYFSQAELRPTADGSAAGSSPVTIESIRLENGTYYVTTEETTLSQAAFDPADWSVYLVYEPGVELTMNVTLSNGAGQYNTIDGVAVTQIPEYESDGNFTVRYQVPTSGSRDIVLTMGAGANLNVTETTSGSAALFSSADDGYQYKSYTLSLLGTQGNRTVNVEFVGVSQNKILDYTLCRQPG